MGVEDLALAVERHATSKLNEEDLFDIRSLGFRGEALPSIGSIAHVEIRSRTRDANQGFTIGVVRGAKQAVKPTAVNAGTVVEVRDLFSATPARLKFLKSERSETMAVTDVVRRLAMAHPEIGFTLQTGEKRPVVYARGERSSAAWLERVGAIMGREFMNDALEVSGGGSGASAPMRVFGFVGLPTLHRPDSTQQFLFVNGRSVKDKLLIGAIRAAYGDLIPRGRSPLLALFLDVAPSDIDVNVHPAKAEVRFRDAGRVRGLMVGAMRQALEAAGHRASAQGGVLTVESFSAGVLPNMPPTMPGFSSSGEFGEAAQAPFAAINAPSADMRMPDHAEPEPAFDKPLGAVRAQVHENYIVAQTHDGLVIVDQHAAHERLVYEKLKAALGNGGVARQGLLIPAIVTLDSDDAELLQSRADELAELGLVLESFGEGAVAVRETPALLGETDIDGLGERSRRRASCRWNSARIKGPARQRRVAHGVPRQRSFGPPSDGRGNERAAPPDGSDAVLRSMQPRPPDLRGAQTVRHRTAVRQALTEVHAACAERAAACTDREAASSRSLSPHAGRGPG